MSQHISPKPARPMSFASFIHSHSWKAITIVGALFAGIGSGWAATHYVDLNSPSPTAPFTNWATAAHVIQDAVL
jgi:hypothetical protein